MQIELDEAWKAKLQTELDQPYFRELYKSLSDAYLKKNIYPESKNIFRAFTLCPFEKVKVIIIGQDPYHGEGQAHGLSFSVPYGVKIPPSLRNIYKEIENDLKKEIIKSGNLEHWAKQGVLLLNSTLTVESGKAGSHQGLGWETLTDAVIKKISDEQKHVVFLLWGNFARSKATLIDKSKHLVLEAPHPSPFSAHSGFFGCKHFSKTNNYLEKNGLRSIEW